MSIIENALAGVRWPECFIWFNVRLNQRYINVNIPVTAFAMFPLDLNEYWHALHGLHIPVYNYNYIYIFIRRFSSHSKVNSIVCVFVIPPTDIVLKWSIRQSLLLTRSAHVTRHEFNHHSSCPVVFSLAEQCLWPELNHYHGNQGTFKNTELKYIARKKM